MALDEFRQNEDIYREIELSTEGSVADTSGFDTIEVKVVHKETLVVIGTYTVAGGTVTKESPTSAGIISFIVPRSATTNASIGIHEFQVTTTETDADYESGVRQRLGVGDCFVLTAKRS